MSELTIMDVDPLAAPMHIWYLDHDPKVAAGMVPDPLLHRAAVEAAKILCCVWRRVAPESLSSEWVPPTPEVVPYTPPEELNALVTKLHGQRVYNAMDYECNKCAAYVAWASASRANYAWLFQYGWHLTHWYSVAMGLPHGAMPVLWVLEYPPELPDEPQTEAPTVVRTRRMVVEDGEEYVDAPESYRAYLLEYRSHMLRWAKREAPSWSPR